MKIICKANKTCPHSFKNNGNCEHSIPHECDNPKYILNTNKFQFDCNCSYTFLRKEKLIKIEKNI